MTQDIRNFLPCDLLAIGEPTHGEPAFARTRNELFAQLAGQGFRSIALETDRVAALAVDDYVRHGAGTLDAVMRVGFSHGLGNVMANRELITWMREYNQYRSPEEQLAFHGFDTPTEMTSAPSPRRYLEHVRDYLGVDIDILAFAGADDRWSSTEAVMDPAASPGATADAEKLRLFADDMEVALYTRAPELVAATSADAWHCAEIHLSAGMGLLRYHRESARQIDQQARMRRMLATRDALMAQNLLAIRHTEIGRGPTLAFAHNHHLRRNESRWKLADLDLTWFSAGSIVGALLGAHYVVVVGSLGRSEALGLAEPATDTYEGVLQRRFPIWGLTSGDTVGPARLRCDVAPEQGYFPLDDDTVATADGILHINA